jgi:hypothetical protein
MARRNDLSRRIDRAYREATGATHKRGAGKWIAQLARLHPMTVSRILGGAQPPDRIEAVLDAIEHGRRLARAHREKD